MTIKKGFIYLIVFISILTIAGSAMAVTINNPLGGTDTFAKLLVKITQAVGGLIAGLGTIMIIISGILFLTSAGSPNGITRAKTALVYAIIGITIGLAATAISTTILNIIGAGTT